MDQVDKNAKIIWNYMLMHQKLEKADIIFILGSNDLRVADRAAEIYKAGWSSLIICSGGNGKASNFSRPEAEVFSERIITQGISKGKIILEPKSANTGENILFTKKTLQQMGIQVRTVIAVNKPYMERRTFAAMKKQWPGIDFIVTSQKISYEEYFSSNLNFKDRNINTMVGDLLRIKKYPKLGFQIEQEIPEEVWQAGQELIKLGYNKYVYLVK